MVCVDRALSVKWPWAWLVTHEDPQVPGVPLKDVENRTWPLPADVRLPMRVYVHAGKKIDVAAPSKRMIAKVDALETDSVLEFIRSRLACRPGKFSEMVNFMAFEVAREPRMWCGAIVGEVDIVGQTREIDSRWFVGPFGFELKNPEWYGKPIPYRGSLGFFPVVLSEVVKSA